MSTDMRWSMSKKRYRIYQPAETPTGLVKNYITSIANGEITFALFNPEQAFIFEDPGLIDRIMEGFRLNFPRMLPLEKEEVE